MIFFGKRAQAGFTMISAIVLLVVLMALGAAIVQVTVMQNTTSVQDLQGLRAYHAARAGIDWGLYQVLDPGNATVAAMVAPYGSGAATFPNLPGCFADKTLVLEGFNVLISCAASVTFFEAGDNRQLIVYTLMATAANCAAAGGANCVERQMQVMASKCRAKDGAAPAYECP